MMLMMMMMMINLGASLELVRVVHIPIAFECMAHSCLMHDVVIMKSSDSNNFYTLDYVPDATSIKSTLLGNNNFFVIFLFFSTTTHKLLIFVR